jgi:hypothetical protein
MVIVRFIEQRIIERKKKIVVYPFEASCTTKRENALLFPVQTVAGDRDSKLDFRV